MCLAYPKQKNGVILSVAGLYMRTYRHVSCAPRRRELTTRHGRQHIMWTLLEKQQWHTLYAVPHIAHKYWQQALATSTALLRAQATITLDNRTRIANHNLIDRTDCKLASTSLNHRHRHAAMFSNLFHRHPLGVRSQRHYRISSSSAQSGSVISLIISCFA